MYNAMTIAKWFIAWAEEDEEADLSNLKLQKLLYYAQGQHLARYDAPLFGDEVVAWSTGPAVPDVYREYERFGSRNVVLPRDDQFNFADVDKPTSKFLGTVWNTYAVYAAWHLRDMIHEERPWKDHFDGQRSSIIPKDELKRHFEATRR